MVYLLEEPLPRDRKRREEKSPAPAGIEPTTSRVLLSRRVLYCCAATKDETIKVVRPIKSSDDVLKWKTVIFR